MNLVHTIEHHPALALVISLFNITAAWAVKHMEIPTIVMQSIQILAWAVTIVLGIISIHGAWKKRKQNKKKKP